jgi:hypothetical protein
METVDKPLLSGEEIVATEFGLVIPEYRLVGDVFQGDLGVWCWRIAEDQFFGENYDWKERFAVIIDHGFAISQFYAEEMLRSHLRRQVEMKKGITPKIKDEKSFSVDKYKYDPFSKSPFNPSSF